MKIKPITDEDYDRLFQGYASLLEWADNNEMNGQETLGLLMKAAVSLAVYSEVPRSEFIEVINVLYVMERMDKPTPDEVH